MGLDANEHLIFSHPGDYYESRHSIRLTDLRGTPLLEFGEQGSSQGQFETPAGVASWGDPCSVEGPYADDSHTLLLLHFDGDYSGTQGETGTAIGTEFVPGRYGQGVYFNNTDTLTYATAGNLNRTEGAVEFWLRPNWPGNDMQSYTFFEVGDGWFNRMRVMKDGANNLRFMLWDSAAEYGVAYNVGDWEVGEWHHIAAIWQGTDIALYVDGIQVASDTNAHPPDALSDMIYVGSASWQGQRADAVIDELRISDIARIGNSDTCNHILVADSGNHRIQAFDSLGNFITEFGSPGDGYGQFNNPQGLAVDKFGRVIVVDQGNDRLVVLSFDGNSFGVEDIFSAGFNSPTDVAVDSTGNLYIADTNNNRIVVLDPEGNYLTEYTSPNDGYPGAFSAPSGVAVDAEGNIIVADTGNRRVVAIFDLFGLNRVYLPLVNR
jgi:DNA-binding beta-propeller fold protein YncE